MLLLLSVDACSACELGIPALEGIEDKSPSEAVLVRLKLGGVGGKEADSRNICPSFGFLPSSTPDSGPGPATDPPTMADGALCVLRALCMDCVRSISLTKGLPPLRPRKGRLPCR